MQRDKRISRYMIDAKDTASFWSATAEVFIDN